MRIASFNLENLDDSPRAAMPVEARLDTLRPQLERLDADIVCLQEVNAARHPPSKHRSLSALDALVAGTPLAGFHRASTLSPKTGDPFDKQNLVVLSRWPVAARRQVHHDLIEPPRHRIRSAHAEENADDAVLWDRPILHVVIEQDRPGRPPLHVLNMHLRAPLAAFIAGQKLDAFRWAGTASWAEGFFLAGLKRSGQALEARLIVDRILDEDPDAEIVVAGDFNAEEREVPTRILCAPVEDTGNPDLAGRSLTALDHRLPRDRRYTVLHGGRHLMLDHLLVSPRLLERFARLEIHNEALEDELLAFEAAEETPVSFHAPIVAEFTRTGTEAD